MNRHVRKEHGLIRPLRSLPNSVQARNNISQKVISYLIYAFNEQAYSLHVSIPRFSPQSHPADRRKVDAGNDHKRRQASKRCSTKAATTTQVTIRLPSQNCPTMWCFMFVRSFPKPPGADTLEEIIRQTRSVQQGTCLLT